MHASVPFLQKVHDHPVRAIEQPMLVKASITRVHPLVTRLGERLASIPKHKPRVPPCIRRISAVLERAILRRRRMGPLATVTGSKVFQLVKTFASVTVSFTKPP